MNWNDLEVMWQRQPLPDGATADLASLRETFEAKRRKTRLIVQLRNGSEAGAGVAVIGFFVQQIWTLGPGAWPLYISLALILGVTARFVRDFWRVYWTRRGPEASLLAKLDAEIEELRRQRRFLFHWGTWYLLPCVVALIAGFWGVGRARPANFSWEFIRALMTTPASLVFIVLLVGTIVGALLMARRAVQKSIVQNIEPRIVELERLRDSMTL